METFNNLGIIEPILQAIKSADYKKPTPIQAEAIPAILAKFDILGSAQTGTGKTAAFAIPIIQQIIANKASNEAKVIKALILTPTRELASQVAADFITYSKYVDLKTTVIFGGVHQKSQQTAIKRGVDILVATPGRLMDLMKQGIISLANIEYFVLDEADQMLDMGFIKDVYKIIKKMPKERQTMLFSATMPKAIEQLSRDLLKNPIRISVTPVNKTLDVISQELYYVSRKNKTALLIDLIKEKKMKSVLVFTRTKANANKLVTDLKNNRLSAEAIHGNKSQRAREKALSDFKVGKVKILVATDIAARGIDISELSFVVNYNLPEVAETYIHRIGRTGRAGESGSSISFCDELEKGLLNDIEKHIKMKIDVIKNHPYELAFIPEVIKGQQGINYNKKQNSGSRKNSMKVRKHRPGKGKRK